MAEFRIPEDVARFVLEQIDSVAQLEALLLLRNDRNKDWNAPTLAARLYIGEEETAHMPTLLRDRGFVRRSGDDPALAPDSERKYVSASRATDLRKIRC